MILATNSEAPSPQAPPELITIGAERLADLVALAELMRDAWTTRSGVDPDKIAIAVAKVFPALYVPIVPEITEQGRMTRIGNLIRDMQVIQARYGNTCVYVRDLSWGAVALNREADDKAIAAAGLQLVTDENGKQAKLVGPGWEMQPVGEVSAPMARDLCKATLRGLIQPTEAAEEVR